MSTLKKLRDGYSKHRSVKVHVAVAILQLLISIGLMIPVICLEYQTYSYVDTTSENVMEPIMYLVFETFRLGIVLDSIIQMNVLTIYITAFLAIIVFASSIITLVLFLGGLVYTRSIDTINIIQIAFSSSLILLTIPALWAAYKMSKDFNWGVYRKIGASMDVQKRYRAFQWFTSMIKLDIFFEFVYFQMLTTVGYKWDAYPLHTITYFLTLASIIIGREAVARENYIFMIVSLGLQVEYLAVVLHAVTGPLPIDLVSVVFKLHLACSILCCLGTIIFGFWCMLNFNKGLKEHVQWSFFGLRDCSKLKETYNKQNASEELLSTKIDMPIDED